MYSLTGGGLPSNVRTVYVELFENNTTDEALRGDVQRALQQRLPRELGVRLAPQATADAIIRGRLTGYDEQTININGQDQPGGRVQPVQRRLQITFESEIYDVRADKVLWKGNSISAVGDYNPTNQTINDARAKAVIEVVQKVVQGAQSQW
ncbi:MAG TPA: LPS assembly lipoprotein LptE [Longimicrobium sp.]|nr:LPS assembly lipoprotein LptE [Longimicrobium sp.]